MKKNIAILAWDWIWEEVIEQSLRVLSKIATKFWHEFSYEFALIWWAAYDKCKNHFPKETRLICENSDAILFWSVGWPINKQHEEKWLNCEANSILALRKTFWFNANFRPVQVHSVLSDLCPLTKSIVNKWIDMLIIRELIWDIYFWKHETSEIKWKRYATDLAEYNEDQISNIAKTAFEAALKRNNRVVSIDKANVLDTSKLWRQVVTEVSNNYKEVTLEHMLVDNAAMQIIKDPNQFDVILAPNLFWDILSDLAAVLPWSLWLMPSASINSEWFWLYEPAWGSAQDIAGKGLANPIAQILSAAMCLKFSFWLLDEAQCIENAVMLTLEDWYRTWDIYLTWAKKVWTVEITNEILNRI